AGIVQRKVTPEAATIAKTIQGLKDQIIQEANASNVSFYIINPEGLQPATNNQAVYWLAEQTGGKMMPGNDLKASVRQFDDASSNYYSLGFRPGHDDDGKYHALTVKVTKPGQYKLQHRAGYSSMTVDAQLGRALQSHIVSTLDTGVSAQPVTLTTEATEPIADRKDVMVVPFSAKFPVSKLQFLPAGDLW